MTRQQPATALPTRVQYEHGGGRFHLGTRLLAEYYDRETGDLIERAFEAAAHQPAEVALREALDASDDWIEDEYGRVMPEGRLRAMLDKLAAAPQPAEAVALELIAAGSFFPNGECKWCGFTESEGHEHACASTIARAALTNQPAADDRAETDAMDGGTVVLPPMKPAAEGLDAIVRDLASLSSADSPEFRDPGWDDAIRSLIRRARLAAAEQEPQP